LNTRCEVINKLTNSNQKYLEIGVEYGQTFNRVHFFNKIGVDPDPKLMFNKELIVSKTSDNYFNTIKDTDTIFDVIFIDGMHQTEFILNDINNSIKHLSEDNDSTIFIDDILPFNYFEQLKIPIQHHYENNILKYDECWTGDIWKVLYHILKYYSNFIKKFSYYYNNNFRGIGKLEIKVDSNGEKLFISPDEIEQINKYDYFTDYPHYLKLITTNI
jgi:hypothetical protein